MLKTFQKMVAGEATEQPGQASPIKALLAAADKTRPGTNVRRLPIDNLAKLAQNATPKVVDAEIQLDKLTRAYSAALEEVEVYTKTLKDEFEKKITEADVALHKAKRERRKAQYQCIRELIEGDAFNGVDDLNELARSKEFQEIENDHD